MRRTISLLLSLLILLSMILPVRAYGGIDLGQTWDNAILAGGIYDMYVWVGDNPDDYTYQWQADTSFGKGHWIDLEDNADPYGYSGTQTYHMQLITDFGNGMIIGTGWEDIPFRCVVTHKKTGQTRASADMFMNVFASDDLPEYLARQGFGLYEPTIDGAAALKTSDYIRYTTSAPAGKTLKIYTGCWRPSGEHLLRQSDFTETVEIWITENGRTIKTQDLTAYTPYTIGQDAVTIEFKLHHTLGIHDLGYYETKTVKLTTREPDPVACGTTNYEISLLKERYNQSERLISIPKGATVNVTEISSGWYQVSWRGFVGHVASSAITLQEHSPIIDHVDLTVAEPLAGNVPSYSCSIEPETCIATYMEWYDKTAKREMVSGDRFQAGHDYQLVIWAAAEPGYSFKLGPNEEMLTTAMINGSLPAYTSRAYEQINGKVIDIRYDFINVKDTAEHRKCNPKPVEAVAPTCTADGHERYYKCSCGKCYSDAQGNCPIDPASWGVLPATGHTPSAWKSTETDHYKICTTCGERLEQGTHSSGAGACAQQATCDICGCVYNGRGEHLWSPTWLYQDDQGHAWICANCKTNSPIEPHTPGPEATETDPQICLDCGYILAPAKNHVHNLRLIPMFPASCTQSGNLEYYICDGCSDWFSDSSGKTVIDKASVILPPTGHRSDEIWHFNEEIHWKDCADCCARMEETVGFHTDGDSCTLCGYQKPEADAPDSPEEPPVQIPDDTVPDRTEPEKQDPEDNQDPPVGLLIFAICFCCLGVASAVVVIVLKKKGEKTP